MLTHFTRIATERQANLLEEDFDYLSDAAKLKRLDDVDPSASDEIVTTFFSDTMDAAMLRELIELATGQRKELSEAGATLVRDGWRSHLETSIEKHDEKLRAEFVERGGL